MLGGRGDFSLHKSRSAVGPRVQGAVSPEVKWQGCGADHLPPSSVKLKCEWSFASSPIYTFMVGVRKTLPLLLFVTYLFVCCLM